MIGDESTTLVKGYVQGGHIAVAGKPFGVLSNPVKVQQVQHTLDTIAAANAEDTVNGVV